MSLINNIVFAVLNILNNFTENDFMQKTLLTSNCWHKKKFQKISLNVYFKFTFKYSWWICVILVSSWDKKNVIFIKNKILLKARLRNYV